MKVYYINLDSRTDRDVRLTQELKRVRLDWSAQRVEAVYNKNGAIGCGESHVKALDAFVDDESNADEYAVIMEDDFMFTGTREYVQNAVIESLAFDPNIVCFGYRLLDHASYTWVSDHILELNRVFTTSCYMVKRSFVPALKLCFQGACDGMRRGLPVHKSAIDVKWIDLQGPGKGFYGIYPKLGRQMASYSDIEKRYCDYRHMENSVVPTSPRHGRSFP
eukprot:jgi/Tetstr1/447243/TSEL_034680.t1